jgi:thiol-disulfide isomerase/thioredoxin
MARFTLDFQSVSNPTTRHWHMLCRIFVLLFLSAALTTCGTSPMPERATWHGEVVLPEIRVPLTMELDLSGAKPEGHFIVGTEKTPIPEISRSGDSLTLNFSEYGAEIHATWSKGKLTGEYRRLRSIGTKSFPFEAAPNVASPGQSASAPTGTFQVVFEGESAKDAATVARIWKEGPDSYYGTFIAPDGDYGLLEGTPTANGIQFSRFTGWQAFAIELHRNGEAWEGQFHAASNEKPRAFQLQPPKDVVAAGKQTTMKSPNAPFAFACRSLTGELVRNTDDRFKGKALALDIMGTWCHNCMDESPVLEKLYQEHAKDGFEIVGLSFEVQDDAELGRKNLALYRDRYGLTYPLLYCGDVSEANVDKQIKSQLENFFAYPTTLFIDRGGRVKTIHTGFQGPGTGDRYPAQIQKLRDLAESSMR